ncbi:ribosome hibernation-promoting factor, HPF/YfiA family [Chloroflexota bacterium]
MELQVTGTNTELTPAGQRYVERKLGKLVRHLPAIISTKVEITEEKTKSPQQHYLVRATVNSGAGGVVFHGEERGADLFKAVDKVADVMIRQLENHKGKLYDKGRGISLARGMSNKPDQPVEPVKKIVKTKHFLLESMSLDEAIEQMEFLEHSFYLFLDDDNDAINLLYRRNDGNYGLIEPEMG